ncbi:MAG: helix-turn-helix domain-containing protein, partial [Oscillospiraceae bacterium]
MPQEVSSLILAATEGWFTGLIATPLNPSSFSRYFKRIHRKTFTRYLNEVRVGYACKLLLEDASRITTVCCESGFSNVSNFNRQFRTIKGMTPSQYVNRYTRDR